MPSCDSTSSTSASGNRNRYWRSLSELEQADDFKAYLHREFPVAASEFPEGVSRRRWLQLMGASLAVAGATGCRYPEEEIAPFVIRPEGRVPGEVYSRSTNFELAGRVYNLLINNIDGRPVKVEPNTDHPSGGGTDVFSQASVLGLYDPDRSRGDQGHLLRRGDGGLRPTQLDWEAFDTLAENLVRGAASTNGRGLGMLMPPTCSPSNVRMVGEFMKRYPEAVVARYDGVGDDVMRNATTKAFGKPMRQTLAIDQADVVVSIQSDLLGAAPGFVANARGFAERRDPIDGEMNRLYVVEAGFTATGAAADSRLAIRPSQMPAVIAEIARRVEAGEVAVESSETPYDEAAAEDRLERFLNAAASDLVAAGKKAVVVVGEQLGEEAVIAGIRLNAALGSLGSAQRFTPEVDADLEGLVSLGELAAKMNDGEIETALILDGNPVFSAPGDIDFGTALKQVENSIYLGIYDDETADVCRWSLPLAHPLESWGDCVNEEGFYGVCQPQILPLLGGRTVAEVLAVVSGFEKTSGEAIVRESADSVSGGSLSDRQWRKLLHDGFADDLVIQAESVSPGGESKPLTADRPVASVEVDQDRFEVVFSPADGIYDGRFANNGWLQEMPQSITKLTWDNAALMSPRSAEIFGLKHGQQIALRDAQDATVVLPIYLLPGIAPGVVATAIGYGRTRAGVVGGMTSEEIDSVGTDVSPIRKSTSMHIATNIEARPRFDSYELCTTQDHWAIDEGGAAETQKRSFNLVREGTTELLKKVPEFVDATTKAPHVPKVGRDGSPFEEPINMIEKEAVESESQLPQWGMSVDLSKCIGCNACVVACQSENNVPIVGKEQVGNSREMHWLRIDRYFQGNAENLDNVDVVQEPVACMHCETAPCEQVCPVAATVHTEEGINAMAYNRCIGTRYCANNCPFKVRRFNYFNYNEGVGQGYGFNSYQGNIESANRKLQQLVLNPDVTVRGRGVMEKCTYCIQRVEQGKITAMKEGRRPIKDGDVITACQSACPTRAIEFGNIADPESAVAKKHKDVRSYGMLEQLNVKPRTEYLARVRNPHPNLMSSHQLRDLAETKAPHHGHSGGHGSGHHDDGGHGDATPAGGVVENA